MLHLPAPTIVAELYTGGYSYQLVSSFQCNTQQSKGILEDMKDVVVDEVMLRGVWEYVVRIQQSTVGVLRTQQLTKKNDVTGCVWVCRAYATINRRGIAHTTTNKEKFEYCHEREEEYTT